VLECGAINILVGWAWGIAHFVFSTGIGHAGTLISAILHLCRQKWRTSINRAAEAMHCLRSFSGYSCRPHLDDLVCGSGSKPKLDLATFSQLLM
jgi:hypothetical protein